MTVFLSRKEAAKLGFTKDKPSKFNSSKVELDGYVFDSGAEAMRYQQLKDDLQRGEIAQLAVHPKFELMPSFTLDDHKERGTRYEADFMYLRKSDGARVVEDVKSEITRKQPTYVIKRKLFLWNILHGKCPRYVFVEVLF